MTRTCYIPFKRFVIDNLHDLRKAAMLIHQADERGQIKNDKVVKESLFNIFEVAYSLLGTLYNIHGDMESIIAEKFRNWLYWEDKSTIDEFFKWLEEV